MEVRAAVQHEARTPLSVETLTLDPPRAGEVLVRVAAAGVCHSDVHLADGNLGDGRWPTVLGHEGAGVVEAAGPGVEGLGPGDPVAFCFVPPCRACDACAAGRFNLCETAAAHAWAGTMLDGTTRLRLGDGRPIRHFNFVSCFAERCVVPAASAVPIPPGLPLWQAALLGCGVMTGFGAMQHLTTGYQPSRNGNVSPDTCPSGVFMSSDKPFYINCGNDKIFQRLFGQVLERPDLASDPVLSQLGDLAASNKEFVAEWRAKWGLDLPLWERYLIFVQRLLHGDLGISISSQRPVLQDIRDFAPATLELASIAFLLALVIGIPLGIMAAVRRDSWIDHLARLISLIGVSSPTFWLAFIMLALFYGGLQIAPGPGRIDAIALPPASVTGLYLIDSALAGDWDTFRDALAHLVLPSIVLAAATLGLITRTTRASMLESMQQDYVRVARAKGIRESRIVIGHILPNALIPVVTLGGLAYANLLTGAVLTETVFSWPGLGRYTFRSAVSLDFPAIMGITLIVAVVYLIINLLIDISYALLDPRVVR